MAQTRKQNVTGEYFVPGHRITGTAAAVIVGQRFVKVTPGGVGNHPNVAQAAAGDRACGVAGYDCPVGADVPIHHTGAYDVRAGAALTGGQQIQSDATGQAIPLAAGVALGTCNADTAAGAVAPIWLFV